ncbi:hypothetical protein BDV93DRAFT_398253, partial [Ceratobasidium sp. AG-I]
AFKDFGQTTECTVQHDPETGRSRLFGFMTFGSGQGPKRLSTRFLNDWALEGRRIKVNLANARPNGGGGEGGGY